MKLTARGRTESNGLGEQALQLREDSRLLIRLKVHLLTTNVAAHKAGSGQLLQLALYSSEGAAGVPHQFAKVYASSAWPSSHPSTRRRVLPKRSAAGSRTAVVVPKTGTNVPKTGTVGQQFDDEPGGCAAGPERVAGCTCQ
jgi:hypothetical protein